MYKQRHSIYNNLLTKEISQELYILKMPTIPRGNVSLETLPPAPCFTVHLEQHFVGGLGDSPVVNVLTVNLRT